MSPIEIICLIVLSYFANKFLLNLKFFQTTPTEQKAFEELASIIKTKFARN